MGEDSPKLVKSIRNLKRSSYVSLLARQEFWCANLPYCTTNIEKKNETKHNRAIKEINKINPGSQVEYDTHKSSIKFFETSFSKYWKRNFRITIGVSAWEVRQSFPQKPTSKTHLRFYRWLLSLWNWSIYNIHNPYPIDVCTDLKTFQKKPNPKSSFSNLLADARNSFV